MTEKNPQKYLDLFQRVVHKYYQFEGQKRSYGTDILLTVSEIHTIDAIGRNQSINLIGLSKIQGVTKGSASQMIYKLVEKGLVEKSTAPNSDREIVLSLTAKGQQAFEGHRQMHLHSGNRLSSVVAEMEPEILEASITHMEQFEAELDRLLKE